MITLNIEGLYIYPVKSLAGDEVKTATLTNAGLKGDREWMIVDRNGKFVSQRKYPLLATLKATLNHQGLILTNKNRDSISIDQKRLNEELPVKIWNNPCQGLPASEDAGRWIADSIKANEQLSLVYFDKRVRRELDLERFGPGYTYFSDAAPFLIANIASLNFLNQNLEKRGFNPVLMDRFRPNIVLSGLAAFEEHNINRITSADGATEITLIDHCQRCAVIAVDQSSGERSQGGHPLKQLAAINAMPKNPAAPAFGVNSVLSKTAGNSISVGDHFTTV